ncbi:NAD-glutamate dehydrogenase [Pseudahrensia aquimaris]|uniref:NAD-glutamate dehydrogenase n=1 Tax=Pseudahrensia aquimaris TaxID=744461 RepID=A0ABW3FDY4_9HYPH
MPARKFKDFSADRKKIITNARKALPKNQVGTAGALAPLLFGEAAIEDLQAQPANSLAGMLQIARQVETKGASRLTIEDHDEDADGVRQTLLTIALPDRPFVVDSTLATINADGHRVHLVIHERMVCENGKMFALMMVVMAPLSRDAQKALKSELKETLDQVRKVTDDWQPMLARLGKTVARFRAAPPPVPADQLAETIQFIEWLVDNNFTLMGLREYAWQGSSKSGKLVAEKGSALGILKDDSLAVMNRGGEPVTLTPEIRSFLQSSDPLIITKANLRSRVHRPTHLDYIGIKRYDEKGGLAGEVRIVGLFTSTAYTKSVQTIPVLRHKVTRVIEESGADKRSHTGKALINILETWPRDELFQIDVDLLSSFATLAAQLDERPRVRVLSRADRFDRFVSAIVYVPRERYDTAVREKICAMLAEVYHGRLSAWYPQFQENGLTRVHVIIARDSGTTPDIAMDELERRVEQIIRTWNDAFSALVEGGKTPVCEFPVSYQERVSPQVAVRDAELLAGLQDDEEIALDFHDDEEGDRTGYLKMFHLSSAVPLSQRVPMLENLGFHVIDETTYEIARPDGKTVHLHDMRLETADGSAFDREESQARLSACLQAVWQGRADDDRFNALVLTAGLDWRQAAVLRAYARYLRQINFAFPPAVIARVLAANSAIAGQIADLFAARFDPKVKDRETANEAVVKDIEAALEDVGSSDDDRVLRQMLNAVQATLRTNFYTKRVSLADDNDAAQLEGAPQPVLAFKVDPSAVSGMPQPVPYREIFISSPRVEGLHLRFGPVARGGLRWSDRAQDYRTEVLGLVKAQQVKNAVIVPVGSKGGFVPKQLPNRSDREAWFEEGRQSYRIYISSLLSVTDNLVAGKVMPPKDVVRHDGDDPYFVVAADKGTSTFSDTANAISQAYDYWLDDAFASGGSAGYDHKKMGITARGGWEAVKRHFREMDRDIQNEPFSVVGVGDMSGDVFGNGMLLSKCTRLIAAFDHRDIFIDPNPGIEKSFEERERLFKADRSSWADYKTDLISKGGGVFSRSAKSIKLPKEAANAIGCEPGTMTPQELMTAILKAPVDLMWFGGIGTYIRASHENNADAGDRANDAIRITAKDLRVKVIGEGANLGVTQDARIEFNRLGGRCNSDAIDNSAGVNSSDVEVNIKIALASAMRDERLNRASRNRLLESMTESVAHLVLRNNYLQTLAISLTERRGVEDVANQQRLMQQLEERGRLDRKVENLPDDVEIAERVAAGEALTRAEIGVLLAYAKIVALDDLVDCDVPDDPYLHAMLVEYFPEKMRKKHADDIDNHRLRREIIATSLANSMINRGGPTFVSRAHDRTGAPLERIARAYMATRGVFDLQNLHNQIDALDTKISGDLQLELYRVLQDRVLDQGVWFVRYGDFAKGIGAVADTYRDAVDTLMPKLEELAPDFLNERIDREAARYSDGGVPQDLARTIARMPIAALIPDIRWSASQADVTLMDAARVFFDVTSIFEVGRIVQAARDIDADDYYDALALDRALQSLHRARRDIVVDILSTKGGMEEWRKSNSDGLNLTRSQMRGIVDHDKATVSRLTVAANILGDLARR